MVRAALSRSYVGLGAMVAAVILLIGLTGEAAAAPQGQSGRGMHVEGSVSGSTLTVDVRGRGNAKCVFWLGKGKNQVRLPGIYLGPQGRGTLSWPIPSDAKVGSNRLKAWCGSSGVRLTDQTFVDIPESAVSGTLSTVLNVLLDIVLGISLLLFFALLILMVVKAPPGEHFGRGLALIGGALVALGAEAAGVGFAEYVVDSLAGSGTTGVGVKLLSIIVPGGAAIAFGWYFSRAVEHSTLKAIRWMVFLGMLTIVTFATIFAEATDTQGVFLGAAAIPNTSFVVGLIFSVLAFSSAEDEEEGRGGWLREIISGRISRRPASNPFADD